MVYYFFVYAEKLNINGCPTEEEAYSTGNSNWDTIYFSIAFRTLESISWGFHMPLSFLLSSPARRKAIYQFFSLKQD